MGGEARVDARLVASRVVTSWWFVVALALWALNDQVAKMRWPGAVTGKASDALGLVVAPLLVASAVALVIGPMSRRAGRLVGEVSVAVVAVGFAAVKASPGVAAWVSDVWSTVLPNRILADRTDLLALLAVPIAVWLWRSAVDAAPARPVQPSDARTARSTRLRRLPRLLASLSIVVVGSVVTTATSCVDEAAVSRIYTGVDGRVYAVSDGGRVAASDDGEDWTVVDIGDDPDREYPERAPDVDAVSVWDGDDQLDEKGMQYLEICGSSTCWRAFPGGSLFEREISTGAEREIQASGRSDCGATQRLATMTLAELDGQEVLVASNADQGVVRVVAGAPATSHPIDFFDDDDDGGGIDIRSLVLVGAGGAVLLVAFLAAATVLDNRWKARREQQRKSG